MASSLERTPCVLVTARGRKCAVPLSEVRETMRPQPIEKVASLPAFVLGVSVVRGAAVPVVDLGALLGGGSSTAFTRFVTIAIPHEGRSVALAVDAVIGIEALELGSFDALPPLLREAAGDVVEAMGTLDSALVVVLRTARLVPDEVWAALAAPGHHDPRARGERA